MPYTDAGKNEMLDALAAKITHVAVFSGDPSGAGTELNRQTAAFNAAAAGTMDNSAQPEFSIQGGETVDHVAWINANNADELLAYDPVTAETFASAGTYTLSDADLDLNG